METIQNWQDIIDNLRQFSYVVKRDNTNTLDRFSSFYHWYYFPKDDAFAPSKFIGYKGTTIDGYAGLGSGSETQIALAEYFDKLPKEGDLFGILYQKLNQFASSVGKTISAKTLSGAGGIYIPKEQYSQIDTQYSQQLFDISTDDIEGYKEEEASLGLEGQKKERLVNVYERNPNLRAKAIQIHGIICKVCEFDFEKNYGEHGKEFIEVHHLKPLHSLKESSLINPATDMTVLCANCHRMIHRDRKNPLTIEQLKTLWIKYSRQHSH